MQCVAAAISCACLRLAWYVCLYDGHTGELCKTAEPIETPYETHRPTRVGPEHGRPHIGANGVS